MNRVYRLIWNEVTGAWTVASEIARRRGKRSSTVLLLAASLAMLQAAAAGAQTLPSGGIVTHGDASLTQSGSHLRVNQTSQYAILNWNDFSIGKSSSVHFANGTGATLNRVTGALPSLIDGKLSATGSLYLLNRNGVVIGPDGVINAAGFMASTLDIRDDEFMAGGPLRLFGDSRAGIVNLGSIHADSGDVTLVAHSVRNDGTITAPRGAAELLAGHEVFFASPDAPGVLVSVGEGATSTGDTGVSNSGLIEAAQARMEAANGNLYALAINQSGVIRATGASTEGGRIVLTADGGTVQQSGKLTARKADGSGGDILIGGDYQGSNVSVANATRTIVTSGAEMDASATAARGDGGRVIVWADEDTRFAGSIEARGGEQGGDGGFVEVSGKNNLEFRPDQPIDLSAQAGKTGTVLLDPDQIEVVATAAGPNQVAVSDIEAGLAIGNYTLTTSNFDPNMGDGSITVSDDLSWTSANTLKIESGNNIQINANITASNGALELYAGRFAEPPGETYLPPVVGGAMLEEGKTIEVDRLRYGANANSLPDDYTLDDPAGTYPFEAFGALRVDTLELDLAGGRVGLMAENTQNAIGAFRTTGTGDMSYVSVVDGEGDLAVRLAATNSNSNGVSIVTPGNLTLESGSSLSLADNGFVPDVVLASTGGNFINNAGSDVFGGNLRFLIYSNSRAGIVKGGLTGTEEFSRTYAGNPPDDFAGDSINRFLFVQSAARPELTYRADDLWRYYGAANPGLTYSVSGLQPGDLLEDVVSGAPVLTTTATLRSGVGAYIIDISQGSLSSSTYDFLFFPGTLTIKAAPLILDIANATRFYGAANPELTASVIGLRAGDTAADILAGWKLATNATRSSNVGGYSIDAERLASANPNYDYTVNPGVLTINPTPVTLTLAPTSRIYGAANPDFRNLAVLTGTYNGDTLATAFPSASFGTAATSESSVGSYAVNAIGGFSNPNYLLTIGSLGELSITKAPLVINANNASRFYGDDNPVFTVASVTGWKNGDTLDSILPGLELVSSATLTSNVGGYAIVPSGSATNYEFVAGTGVLAVTKAPLDVYLNAATRYYGDSDPLFTATYEGLKNGETSLPGLAPVSNTNVFTPIGNYVISAGGTTTFQNYLPTFYAGVLTIAPRPLTIIANNATRTYGADDPAFSVSVDNVTSWDAAQAANYWVAGTDATRRSDVGSYAIGLDVNPYGEHFDNLSNYAVTLQPGTFTVTRAPLIVSLEPIDPIYWGDEVPPSFRLNGLMPWDTASSAGTVRLTYAGGTAAPPGTYPVELVSNAIGTNYEASLHGDYQVQVLRRPITITGNFTSNLDDLGLMHPGQIVPFTVTSYDDDGNPVTYSRSTALPGGPQFIPVASSDGTRRDGLGEYVTQPGIQTVGGYHMDDVLAYYEPTFVPGTAVTPLLTSNENVLHPDYEPPQPPAVVVDQQTVTTAPAWGNPPSIDRLFYEVDREPDDLISLYDDLNKSGGLKALPAAAQELLRDAAAIERANLPYLEQIAQSEAWIARLKEEKPANWEFLVAGIEADIANWRSQLQPGGLDALTQLANGGDADAMAAVAPLLSVGLMKALEEGRLPPQAEEKLIASINLQRAELAKKVEAKYEAFAAKEKMRADSLGVAMSGTKMPDIVGDSYKDLYTGMNETDRALAVAATGAVTAYAVVAAATIAATTTGAAGMSGVMGTMAFAIAGVSAGGAGAAVALAGAFAVVVGVAEAVQVFETEANRERYENFQRNNTPITLLSDLKLEDKDNRAQAMMAIQGLLTETFSKATPAEQGQDQ